MHNLSKREKLLLKVLITVVSSTLLYSFIIEPLFIIQDTRSTSSESKAEMVEKIDNIYSKYRKTIELKKRLDLSLNNTAAISSIINEISGSLNILTNKTNLKESPGKVQNGIQKITTEINFEGVSVKPLLEFINRLENSSTLIKIKRVKIYSAVQNRSNYDAIIEIDSFIKK